MFCGFICCFCFGAESDKRESEKEDLTNKCRTNDDLKNDDPKNDDPKNKLSAQMKIRQSEFVRLSAIFLVALLALTITPLAFSQGCSLCYTQAANSGARMIRALKSGIVILIIPPISMCLGAMVLAYRRRNQFNQANPREENGSDW